MNYRHAFHAGNFADVHKHAVLAWILNYLRAKPTPFRVIDTHAGAARYDLFSRDALRGGEWRDGIDRIWKLRTDGRTPAFLAPYLDIVAALNPAGELRNYPGSPLICAALLRSRDRLIACELEPRSAAMLTAALRGERGAKVLLIDGWTALGAYVPPKEKRGLVLVDPPFEETDEFSRLGENLAAAYHKWPGGIYMVWYPIKDRKAADTLARAVRRFAGAKMLRSELILPGARRPGGLRGSGLILINPPFTLDQQLRLVMPVLEKLLAAMPGDPHETESVSATMDFKNPRK
jgi:23S rRNA (adenine2030-N6)-methyltransferase